MIRILLVVGKDYRPEDEQMLLDSFRERLGEKVNVVIEKVDELKRMRSGKFKWVVSKVKLGI